MSEHTPEEPTQPEAPATPPAAPEPTPAPPSAAASGGNGAILEVNDIHTYYGSIHALKGISLEVRQGEIVTLIGANGAGKSTTLRSINGLNRPRKGTIRFQGKDITSEAPHRIVGMGIAQSPEGRKLFPHMSVLENLEMGAFQRTDRPGIREDLERVYELFPRLNERRTQKAGTLSGGEQQMVAMGRGLMARPKLLMLDEPSMGLAPIFVEKIFEIVVEINQQGTPILLVEQNALMALDVAHRGYVMETGHIALTDEAKALAKNEQVRKAYLGE
jgi:branched-chain amino acid transport system ATP-binding protein